MKHVTNRSDIPAWGQEKTQRVDLMPYLGFERLEFIQIMRNPHHVEMVCLTCLEPIRYGEPMILNHACHLRCFEQTFVVETKPQLGPTQRAVVERIHPPVSVSKRLSKAQSRRVWRIFVKFIAAMWNHRRGGRS